MRYDCIVVGGGPGGLSAALILGRCRRQVLVCDTGRGRNRWSDAVHGFLSRDGTPPSELLSAARTELERYPTVELCSAEVVDATARSGGFEIECADGRREQSRKLLLASGVVDQLPDIPGFASLYGCSAHHCPYCDGWEWRDQPIAVLGNGEAGAGLAQALTVWSRDLVICTNGPATFSEGLARRLVGLGIRVREQTIERLQGDDGRLEAVVFVEGPPEMRRALFFVGGQHQASELPARFGCEFTPAGAVDTGKCESTNVPGLYVCGDASREAQFVVVAAAEGAEAGMAINKALLEEDLDAVTLAGKG